jgi:hypothetical protein
MLHGLEGVDETGIPFSAANFRRSLRPLREKKINIYNLQDGMNPVLTGSVR